ncbi:hypothetical protein [Kaarinaea lacus]
MKKVLLAILVLAVSMLSVAFAQEQDQEPADVDQVVAMCEEQFTEEAYPDVNERNQLVEECIENKLNKGNTKTEEG